MGIRGGCLRGTISCELDAQPAVAVHCHCSICRRAHGATFGSFAVIAKANFRWTGDNTHLGEYESAPGNQRHFCRECGSHVTMVESWNPKGVTICMGSFYDDPGIRPSGHIFVGSKAPWDEITDELLQADAWPQGTGPEVA
ncbi:MAG: GFA family protein [Gammaproteobacteria bacterium]|jgi:hypothetical protein